MSNDPNDLLRHHVSGAIERGEAEPIVAEDYDMRADWETVSRCPACGDPIDYCQGHGLIGDPIGHLTLQAHDKGRHEWCNAFGCEEVRLGE